MKINKKTVDKIIVYIIVIFFITPSFVYSKMETYNDLVKNIIFENKQFGNVSIQNSIKKKSKIIKGDLFKKTFQNEKNLIIENIDYMVEWEKSYKKYENALYHIKNCDSVIIKNVKIIQNNSDYRASSSFLIEGCKNVKIEKSYFAGTVGSYHIRIEGCEEVIIDSVEICGYDYNNLGKLCGGGILIKNENDKYSKIRTSQYKYDLNNCTISDCYIHDSLKSDRERNQDGINLFSPSNGKLIHCHFENWNAGDAAIDISHRRIDKKYQNKYFSIYNNLFVNCKSIKTPGKSNKNNYVIFSNNIYNNTRIVDYHQGWNSYHVNETFLYDKNFKSKFIYSLIGISNGLSYLDNCFFEIESESVKNFFFLHKTNSENDINTLKVNNCLYLIKNKKYETMNLNKNFSTNKKELIRNVNNNKIIFDKESAMSIPLKFGNRKYINNSKLKMNIVHDYLGQKRSDPPSVGAIEKDDYYLEIPEKVQNLREQ